MDGGTIATTTTMTTKTTTRMTKAMTAMTAMTISGGGGKWAGGTEEREKGQGCT